MSGTTLFLPERERWVAWMVGGNRLSGPASTDRRKKIAFFFASAVIGPIDKLLPRVHQRVCCPSESLPSCFSPSSAPGSRMGRWGQSLHIWPVPYA